MGKEDKDPVRVVLDGILKRAGKGAAHILSEGADSDVDEVIPTGIDVLDHHVLGIGGLPLGRIVELFADEGDGKTSLMFQCMAGVQREGGIVALAETEHALDSQRAGVFGCDLERVILGQPDTMEEALSWLEAALESLPTTKKGDPPNGVFWDSLAATPTKAEYEEGIDGKAAVADRARLMSKAMRVLTGLCTDRRALLMIVNQTRTKLGVMFGSNRTTPGGNALKFHASVRLELFSGKAVKDGDDHIGKQVTIMATKTKVGGRPWAKAKVRLYYETGWSNAWATVWHAKDRKVIDKAAKYNEESYVAALKALSWSRGFATGSEAGGDVVDTDSELLGDE